MKSNKLIAGLVLVIALLLEINSFAQYIICIDPGHGGPDAGKYWENGGGKNGHNGAMGPYLHLTEQWINLEVARELRWRIGFFPNFPMVMTRETDTTDISTVERAQMANDSLADWYISIHHQGLLPGQFQRTMAFYCNAPKTPVDPFPDRDTDSLLAKKTLFWVQNYFHYADGCSSKCGPAPDCKDRGILECNTCYDVLRYSTMVSVLSEASNINNDEWEESLFDANSVHISDEASGLYYAWRSYWQGAGIVTVKTKWLNGDGGQLRVDGEIRGSPFVTSWAQFEQHTLQADYQYLGGYYCEPHHWLEVETGYTYPSPLWIIVVPAGEATHTYIAYYKGGPYYANLFTPDGGDLWIVGDTGVIIWNALWSQTSIGVDTITLIDVFLDRNSGNGGYPERLFTGIPRKDYAGVAWKVTGPASNKCRVKVVAHDCVDNTATDVSSYDFTIRFPNIAGDANTDGNVTVADVVYLVNYFFKGGPPPDPLWKGDANGDCKVSVSDVVYLISYLMKGGPPPICKDSCWGCMRALAKDDEKPYTKGPSFLEKIFKGDKESIEKKIESDFKSGSK
ncbi:MAG: N-acetylmuramoyl-L-alanine amidase [candidate division Zixibacteria bacterium]|nr:N-acetylmuramoyl-L-alanine amidase [candidate division Zixibacteria bacterium]